jgi:hypothetical protein
MSGKLIMENRPQAVIPVTRALEYFRHYTA